MGRKLSWQCQGCNVHSNNCNSNNVNRTKSTVLVLVLKYRPWFKESHDGFKVWPLTIVLWDCPFHLNRSWLQWKKLSNNLEWLIWQYFLSAWFKDQLLKLVQWHATQMSGSVFSIYKALKSIVEACELHGFFAQMFLQLWATSFMFTISRSDEFSHFTWSFYHELSLYL